MGGGRGVGRGVRGAGRRDQSLGRGGGQVVGERRRRVVGVLDEGVLGRRGVRSRAGLPLGEGGVEVVVVGPVGDLGTPVRGGGLAFDVGLVLRISVRG